MSCAMTASTVTTMPPLTGNRTSSRGALSRSTLAAATTTTRPATGKSITTSSGEKSSFIVALSEARGICLEIGMCAFNLATGACICCQFVDSQTYIRTLHKLNLWDVAQVLVPASMIEPVPSKLVSVVEKYIPDIVVVPAAKKFFSDTAGLTYLKRYALKEDIVGMLLVITAKLHCLSALGALFQHIELVQDLSFSPQSLYIKYQAIEGTMMIDPFTAKNMELTINLLHGSAKQSLFGVLHCTKTPMGHRLLRTTILQPLTDVTVINKRLDAVEELIQSDEMQHVILETIKDFVDVDHIIAKLVQVNQKPSIKASEQNINTIIYLKHTLKLVLLLRTAISTAKSGLLLAVHQILCDNRVKALSDEIDNVINEDIILQKTAIGLRNQRCYAVKAGCNGLLDVARQTYRETTNDIHELVQNYTAEYNMPLKLQFSPQANFYLELKHEQLGGNDLPPLFLNVAKKKTACTFTTLDLLKYNDRINESLTEIYLMSDKTMTELMDKTRDNVGVLYKISESIALLDVLRCFAQLATHTGYTRPEFTDTLAIKSGRHPIRERLTNERFVSNDTFASEASNIQIITGPNMSGKSTYLRQIALISVMAQMGSYVPAEYSSHRIVDQLFSRLGNDDSIETNASAFMLEMREAAYILQNISDNSLVIIDEMGRGTSVYDGIGIAFAICERLAYTKAFVFFATHFQQLTASLVMYANVVNLHLDVKVDLTGTCPKLQYLYTIQDGRCDQESYGITLAKTLGFPRDVTDEAERVSLVLLEQIRERQQKSEMSPEKLKQRLAKQLVQRLVAIRRNSNLRPDALLTFLRSLQTRFRDACQQADIDFISVDNFTSILSSSTTDLPRMSEAASVAINDQVSDVIKRSLQDSGLGDNDRLPKGDLPSSKVSLCGNMSSVDRRHSPRLLEYVNVLKTQRALSQPEPSTLTQASQVSIVPDSQPSLPTKDTIHRDALESSPELASADSGVRCLSRSSSEVENFGDSICEKTDRKFEIHSDSDESFNANEEEDVDSLSCTSEQTSEPLSKRRRT